MALPAIIVLLLAQNSSKILLYFDIQPTTEGGIYGVIGFTVVIILLIVYTIRSNSKLKIEQIIWLDSYFDGFNLSESQSSVIAKQLATSWNKLQRKIFVRYYLPMIAVSVAAVWFFVYLIGFSDLFHFMEQDVVIGISAAFFGLGGIAAIIWVRTLKIRLSFVPFVFIDSYQSFGTNGYWQSFWMNLQQLASISRDEMFKKKIIIEIAGDASISLTQYVSNALGAAVGSVAALAAKEIGIRLAMFAKYTATNVLYRYAHREVHGDAKPVNQYIYTIK